MMALIVKHLNSDASFLLSFEPVIPDTVADSVIPRPFTILLDPWITGSSTIFHPRISTTSHKQPACISTLSELPRPPDLVIISQHKPDHCNEATLRQLPADGNTLILAEPISARLIKSWGYFDKSKIRAIERWEDPRVTGKQSVIRIPVPPLQPNGQEGEVTIAFIPQKHDLTGLHGAIGITYRSPSTHGLTKQVTYTGALTPPSTPGLRSTIPMKTDPELHALTPTRYTFLLPPTPPLSPVSPVSSRSLRSLRSDSTFSLYSPSFGPATSSQNEKALPPCRYSHSRPISVIFSPHGIQYRSLAPYATSHLVAEAALPLTALLHCIDSVDNPWWLGGNICAGAPYGAEIASTLGARLWISAHDGEKYVRGLATGLLKTRRWKNEEIEGALGAAQDNNQDKPKGIQGGDTELLRLECGEEILVAGTRQLWRTIGPESDILSTVNLDQKIAPPPPPPKLTIPPRSKHRENSGKRTMETLMLSNVQDTMLPKSLETYKTLRTKDWIKPSPKLIVEREATVRPDTGLTELLRPSVTSTSNKPPRIELNLDRSVRLSLST